MRMRKPRLAEAPLRKGLHILPDNPECLSLLGRCLVAQGQHRQAYEIAQQAEQLDSKNPEVWDAVGVVYGLVNEFSDAARTFQRVHELRPDSARNLFNLASMLNFCHQVDESAAAYKKALAIDPKKFIAYWSLSQLKKQSKTHNNIDFLRQQLKRYSTESEAKLHINLALAKELEDIGEYADSFNHLELGMSEKRKQISYHIDEDKLLFGVIKKTFTPDFCQTELAASNNDEAIFIVGMPRTGTTLLERIISSHEQVFAAGELQNFLSMWVNQVREADVKVTPQNVMGFGRQLDYKALGESYINSTRPRTGKTLHFIDKMPNNFIYLGAILKALPNAKIIHMTRNPMDTCYANYKQLFGRNACPYSYSQSEMSAYYQLYKELMNHWQQCFPKSIYTLSYESLVTDTPAQAKALFEYLNLQWDERYLEVDKNSSAVGTASTAQVRQPIYTSSLEKWKNYQQQLQPMLEQLNHSLS